MATTAVTQQDIFLLHSKFVFDISSKIKEKAVVEKPNEQNSVRFVDQVFVGVQQYVSMNYSTVNW